jgi:phosphatidylserine/phosphatidylglycerophosphate/cardiolipin synthase-like enzyme
VYWPVTDGATSIYVHSKVMVIDDQLLRIGSSNLNNRSLGFDSECDVAFEAVPSADNHQEISTAITSVRNGLVAEHLGVAVDVFERVLEQEGSLLKAIEQLKGSGKTLSRFSERTVAGEGSLLAENDLMDPDRVPTSFVRSLQRWIVRLND